jgi:hypothetical protein
MRNLLLGAGLFAIVGGESIESEFGSGSNKKSSLTFEHWFDGIDGFLSTGWDPKKPHPGMSNSPDFPSKVDFMARVRNIFIQKNGKATIEISRWMGHP